jgi:hypothetical protein
MTTEEATKIVRQIVKECAYAHHPQEDVEYEIGRADVEALRAILAALAASEARAERAERRVREMEGEPLEFAAFPDDASDRAVLLYLAQCACRWAPGVRLLGNVRAKDVFRACANAVATLDATAMGEVG